jgi:arginyl-tRNA synthetase
MQAVKQAISAAVKQSFGEAVDPEVTRPDESFGDYATNIALQLAAKLKKSPRTIADQLAKQLQASDLFQTVAVAGQGFINLTLKDEQLLAQLEPSSPKSLTGQEILVEFGDPNPFKEMHIGHLYSYIVGDSICRLLEASGASVRRLSYHGDVGLHVAKAIWGMRSSGEIDDIGLGTAYAKGAKAYEEDEQAKAEIEAINNHIYEADDPAINQLYEAGRERSFAYFDGILADIDVKTGQRYLESQSAPVGVSFVKANLGKVFEQSDGAVVYKGEKAGLHTRVFITSKGLPTYETKDLGLAELKKKDYPKANRSIIITAHEQAEYFKVMLAALGEFDPELAAMTTHLYHGFVSLSTGKMSSRTGHVYGATDLLGDVKANAAKAYPKAGSELALAAVKYGFLKHRLGSDITYDVAESISLEGNSGPYLQYAHARACSILAKAGQPATEVGQLDADERSLAAKLSQYPEVLDKASAELMPHHICNYLYELAQTFNRFYEKCRIVGDAREAARARLVEHYADVLAEGLNLLGIAAPEKV